MVPSSPLRFCYNVLKSTIDIPSFIVYPLKIFVLRLPLFSRVSFAFSIVYLIRNNNTDISIRPSPQSGQTTSIFPR